MPSTGTKKRTRAPALCQPFTKRELLFCVPVFIDGKAVGVSIVRPFCMANKHNFSRRHFYSNRYDIKNRSTPEVRCANANPFCGCSVELNRNEFPIKEPILAAPFRHFRRRSNDPRSLAPTSDKTSVSSQGTRLLKRAHRCKTSAE